MFFGLFRRSANRAVIERLHAVLVAASRQPALFTGLGMTDTFEGRFESLTLHAALVLRALNALPAPGPDLAQDLVDSIFRRRYCSACSCVTILFLTQTYASFSMLRIVGILPSP